MSVDHPTLPDDARLVPDFPGYAVHWLGTVWTSWRRTNRHIDVDWERRYCIGDVWREMKQTVGGTGYYFINLHRDGKCYPRKVHRLILEMYVGPCPAGWYGCHNDGNPLNNRLDNLRWDTPKGNSADKVRHGTHALGVDCSVVKLTDENVRDMRVMRATGLTYQAIADAFGVSIGAAWCAVKGHTWSHVS